MPKKKKKKNPPKNWERNKPFFVRENYAYNERENVKFILKVW